MPAAQIEQMKAETWDFLGMDANDSESWYAKGSACPPDAPQIQFAEPRYHGGSTSPHTDLQPPATWPAPSRFIS